MTPYQSKEQVGPSYDPKLWWNGISPQVPGSIWSSLLRHLVSVFLAHWGPFEFSFCCGPVHGAYFLFDQAYQRPRGVSKSIRLFLQAEPSIRDMLPSSLSADQPLSSHHTRVKQELTRLYETILFVVSHLVRTPLSWLHTVIVSYLLGIISGATRIIPILSQPSRSEWCSIPQTHLFQVYHISLDHRRGFACERVPAHQASRIQPLTTGPRSWP